MNQTKSCVFSVACLAAIASAPLAKGGNISAYMDGGDLVVCGTSGADKVDVKQVGPVTWQMIGMAGTKINGYAVQEFDVYCGMRFDMKGGNDCVVLHDGVIPKSVRVYMGSGNDAVTFSNLTIGGEVSIPEAAVVSGGGSSGGYMCVKGDDGNDAINIANVVVLNNTIWYGGQDSDLLSVRGEGGYGSKWSTIAGCSGNDRIVVQNFEVRKLEVTSGSGKDDVSVQVGSYPSFGCERICVDTGSDTDSCRMNLAAAADLSIEVGPGKSDKLSLLGCSADNAEFTDCGTNGFINGNTNFFGWVSIDSNFTHQSGDLN
ncbi:MAG: hypothetical protein QM755_08905 [Luteolibacter sp.]